jgi:hypothetical protein
MKNCVSIKIIRGELLILSIVIIFHLRWSSHIIITYADFLLSTALPTAQGSKISNITYCLPIIYMPLLFLYKSLKSILYTSIQHKPLKSDMLHYVT